MMMTVAPYVSEYNVYTRVCVHMSLKTGAGLLASVGNAEKSRVDSVHTSERSPFRRDSTEPKTIRADHTGPTESQLQAIFS